MREGTWIDGRFELVRVAGTGAMGKVWRARDRETGGWVAVKISREDAPEPHRLEREARALEELNGPGVVRHVAHGWVRDRPYIVIEWIDGETLAERQRHAPLDVESAVRLGAALARALALAHRAGIVHRDVKPSNVMLANGDPDRGLLIDFSIARLGGAKAVRGSGERPTTLGRALGTPGFMAPEQARGEPVDARTDLFALGCLMYALLAGERPFRGVDAMAVMAASLTQSTPRLSSVRGDLPWALVDLVAELMDKRPAARPQSAEEVAIRLEGQLRDGQLAGLPAPGQNQPVLPATASTVTGKLSPCFGREDEVGRLRRAFERASSQRCPAAVLITGSAGIGKTRLLEELMGDLACHDAAPETWFARAERDAASAPLSLIAKAARSALAAQHGGQQAEVEREVRARLGAVLPEAEVSRVAPFVVTLLTGETLEEATLLRAARLDPRLMADRLQHGLAVWVESAATRCPLLIALDDVHLADAASLELVATLLKELVDVPLCVVLTARDEAGPAPFSALYEAGVERVRLTELSDGAARRLAEHLAPDLRSVEIDHLLGQSGGLPLFVEQLALHGAELASVTLREVVLARLATLSPKLSAVALRASVLGSDFSAASLAALAGDDEKHISTALLELTRAGLLRTSGRLREPRHFGFRHNLVRDIAYRELDDDERRSIHAAAAAELARQHSEPARIAHHLDCAGDHAGAALWHWRAAQRSLQRADLDLAERHVQAGLRGASEASLRGELALVQCTLHNLRGEGEAAAEAGERAMRELGEQRSEWSSAAAEVAAARRRLGEYPALREVACRVLERVAASSGSPGLLEINAWVRIAEELAYVAEHRLALSLLDACEGACQGRELDAAMTARLHDARSTRAYIHGNDVACQSAIREALVSYDALGDVHRACQHQGFLGWSQLELGQLPEAEATLRLATERAARHGLVVFELGALQNLGLTLALRGRLGEAIRVEREALGREATQENHRLRIGCHEILARILLIAGDLEGAKTHAGQALAELRGHEPQRAPCLALLAQSELGLNELEAAVEHANEAGRLLENVGGLESTERLWVLLARAEVLQARGDAVGAAECRRRARDLVLARARRIADPAHRECFLRDGPECARALD